MNETGITDLIDAARRFVEKVEMGLAQSKESYEAFKKSLSKIDRWREGVPSNFILLKSDGMESQRAQVYFDGRSIVVTGDPSSIEVPDSEDAHNCDRMDCRQSHVLLRAFVIQKLDDEKSQ